MSEEFEVYASNRKHCPNCGKRARTFARPADDKSADYRLECDNCLGKWYLTFKLKY